MEICEFINSKDISKYLKEIDYRFNTLEAAYLIYFNCYITLAEKHNAWKELIETMPDMVPKDYFDHFSWNYFEDSIHSCLKQHMENEKNILNDFYSVKKGAYNVRLYNQLDQEFGTRYFPLEQLLTSIDEVNDYIADEIKINDELYKYEILCKPENSQNRFYICKNRSGEVLEISAKIENYPQPRVDWQLETMWFVFPTPFKKGDIVIDPKNPDPSNLWSGPFVFDSTAAEFLPSRGLSGYDYSDMTASGWFQDEFGVIYKEIMHDYMALEYFPAEKLGGVQEILIALSNHVKGEIGDELFANTYHYILTKELAKQLKPSCYSDEGMKLAGLRG